MLTEREKKGIRGVLEFLSSDLLRSVADTASKGSISCCSDEERVKVILTFETSGSEFLRHRVVSKQILTQYAYKENLQGVADCRIKDDIVKLISKYWSNPEHKGQRVRRSARETPSQSFPSIGSPSSNNNGGSSTVNNYYHVNIQLHHGNTSPQSTPDQIPPNTDHLFGKTFCDWFYNMLNHPDAVSQGFGPSHFMPLAQLLTHFASSGNVTENSYSNSIDISNCLLDFSRNFSFLPNTAPDGIRVKSDPHGLKLIVVCGTLHKRSTLCGKFQQSFGLVRDPTGNDNWKIQVTALKCLETYGHLMPQLDDTASDLERITVGYLEKSLKSETV